MIVSTSILKSGMTNSQHIVAPREVSFESLVPYMCNHSPNQLVVSKTRYLFVLDVNGLLCVTQHLKSTKAWKPFFLQYGVEKN
jgi:hypothetical protein